MSGENGRAAVLADAVKGAGAEIAAADLAAAGAQLPMFEVPTRFSGARAEHLQHATEVRQRPGRPPGAANLSNRQFREYLLGRGVSPLVNLMRWALMSPTAIAAELGCSRLEAFREWRVLQAELAPYLHGKALPVDDQGNAVPFFVMNMGAHAGPAEANGLPPWRYLDHEQNQALAPEVAEASHGAASHGEAK